MKMENPIHLLLVAVVQEQDLDAARAGAAALENA
jgi:hypothetical protein